MCCRLIVTPFVEATAVSILTLGEFKPVFWIPGHEVATNWERQIPEEGCAVNANLSGERLQLNITPAISIFAHHAGKRITAGVYFEIAAKYAEKVGGEIVQQANVAGCIEGSGINELLIAHYPAMPLQFDRICSGFKALILGEERIGH